MTSSAIRSGGISGAQFAVLEETGHLAYVERPEEFAAAVTGFVAGPAVSTGHAL
ncbi:hypothetical protein OH779_00710 [Actinacidiphila glaucinigra]|uniref:alpha/beta fold hydrolase n=1 Tax=Actinacidiphila glaucinigra TaxID=235986 RepID=UPI00386BC005